MAERRQRPADGVYGGLVNLLIVTPPPACAPGPGFGDKAVWRGVGARLGLNLRHGTYAVPCMIRNPVDKFGGCARSVLAFKSKSRFAGSLADARET